MQTFRDEQLISTDQGAFKKLAERAKELQESEGATHHIIGLFPAIGQIVVINGLQFEVDRVSSKKKRIRLRLISE